MYSKKKYFIMVSIFIIQIFLLTGCLNQKSTPEKMYEVMEKVVIAENSFEEQQDPLVNAEKKEKQLYDKIISLGMKQFNEIVKLSDEALVLVEERESLMNKETESIEMSKEQFEKLDPYLEKLKEPSMQKDAKELYEVMMERYDLHNQLQQTYLKGLEYDKQLYEMFKNKDIAIDQIENQINRINDTYTKVYQINAQFNLDTQKYNDLKLAFYQKAGFKIDKKD